MSAVLDGMADRDEAKLAEQLLRKRIIAEGQLNAALDFQRSLGGRLDEVFVKLGLLRPSQLEEVAAENSAQGEAKTARASSELALDPSSVQQSHLKVHRRLLDKIPRELIAQYLLVTFFPLPNGNSRKVVLGHGRGIPRETVDRIRAMLGVDLCTLELEPRVVKELVSGSPEVAGKEAPVEQAPREAARPSRGEDVLVALMKILARKGIVTREEIERELQSHG